MDFVELVPVGIVLKDDNAPRVRADNDVIAVCACQAERAEGSDDAEDLLAEDGLELVAKGLSVKLNGDIRLRIRS